MGKASRYESTKKILEESSDDGLTLDELSEVGIPKSTFFRHRAKINESGKGEAVETFAGSNGETRFRLRKVTSDSEPMHKAMLQSKVLFGDSPSDFIKSEFDMKSTLKEDFAKRVMELSKNSSKVINKSYPAPYFNELILNETRFAKLKTAITDKVLINITEYEAEIWERWGVFSSLVVLPQSIVKVGSECCLEALWDNEEVVYKVFLNLSNILSYSKTKYKMSGIDSSKIQYRFTNVVIGVKSLVSKVQSEIWNERQIDLEKNDKESQNILFNLAYLGSIDSKTSQVVKDNVDSFKMVRILPNANELVMGRINSYGSNLELLNYEA